MDGGYYYYNNAIIILHQTENQKTTGKVLVPDVKIPSWRSG